MDRINYINGKWESAGGPEFTSVNPATEEVIWSGSSSTDQDVKRAVAVAESAFVKWVDVPLTERISCLYKFRELLELRKADLAETISKEVGKPLWESLTEVKAMIDKVELSIRAYQERCAPIHGEIGGGAANIEFKPIGVIAVLGPFNLPGHLPNGQIIPALLAGNTVVFKPSEQSPLVGQFMAEIWEAAGIPPGVINLVQGGMEAGSALASDPRINGLFFTGSAQTGKALHRQFGGKPDKMLVLEMGGNNPLVVHDVEDYDAAVFLTIQSAYITSGQRCSCARRLIVTEDVKDGFIDLLAAKIKDIIVGPYTDRPEPFMGPVISARVVTDLLAAHANLLDMGGRAISELHRIDRRGYFLTPGLIDVTGVGQAPDIEYFGPFLQLIRVPDLDAAIREANTTTYGLAAGLLSDSREAFVKFHGKVKAGIINWNRQTTNASGAMPFGGTGSSGNFRPAGYLASDFCSYPVSSIEIDELEPPPRSTPGLS
jgi:succinylglutamic semialdehyde dehydrogenase